MSEKKHDQEPKAEKGEKPEQASLPARPPRETGLGLPPPESAGKSEAAEPLGGDGETGEDKSSGHKATKGEAEAKALRLERNELKDKYLRVLAEMENLRKRADREKSEYYQYALAEVLKDLLTF